MPTASVGMAPNASSCENRAMPTTGVGVALGESRFFCKPWRG